VPTADGGLHAVIADNPSDREQIERIRQHLQEEARTVVQIVGSVPPERAGAASALSTTASDLGTSLGIALIDSIV
jgi:hypothetical protein